MGVIAGGFPFPARCPSRWQWGCQGGSSHPIISWMFETKCTKHCCASPAWAPAWQCIGKYSQKISSCAVLQRCLLHTHVLCVLDIDKYSYLIPKRNTSKVTATFLFIYSKEQCCRKHGVLLRTYLSRERHNCREAWRYIKEFRTVVRRMCNKK